MTGDHRRWSTSRALLTLRREAAASLVPTAIGPIRAGDRAPGRRYQPVRREQPGITL